MQIKDRGHSYAVFLIVLSVGVNIIDYHNITLTNAFILNVIPTIQKLWLQYPQKMDACNDNMDIVQNTHMEYPKKIETYIRHEIGMKESVPILYMLVIAHW